MLRLVLDAAGFIRAVAGGTFVPVVRSVLPPCIFIVAVGVLGRLGRLLFQHQLFVFVLDLTRFVVAGEFAAVILIHTLGNDDLFLTRIGQLGHADAAIAAIQTLIANGDVGAPHQIHIAGSTILCVLLDGRRIGHGEGAAVHKHTVAGVAADGAVVHVEGAG